MASLRVWQLGVFIGAWVAYASTYLLRKPLGLLKPKLETYLRFNKVQLGWLDTAFLLPYACVQIFLGNVGDKFGPRQTLAFGLTLPLLFLYCFYSYTSFSIIFISLALSGGAQGLCWPNVCKILSSWYPDKSRSTIFGLFGTSAFAGGIIGTAVTCVILDLYKNEQYANVFSTPSIVVFIVGVFVFLWLKSSAEVGIAVPGKEVHLNTSSNSHRNFFSLWRIPMVIEIAIAMFCLKLVRYCMYMWLPLYLIQNLKYTTQAAGWFSTVFEIGGVVGSALLGIAIDKVFSGKSLVGTTVSAAGSSLALLLFFITGHMGIIFNGLFMMLAGALNCGPDTILGGSLPSEIGERDNRNAAAAVIGLVNGVGSIGACLEGPIVGYLAETYGWDSMFYFIFFLSVFGTVMTFRALLIDNKQRKKFLPLRIEDINT